MEDLYRILGCTFYATKEEIKNSFRGRAKIYHPDNRESGDSVVFQKIVRAYEILTHPEKRILYDSLYGRFFQAGQEEIGVPKRIFLPTDRIVFTSRVSEFAKVGLMRKGYRMKDRTKFKSILFDVILKLEKTDMVSTIVAKIPLTTRVLCPECNGSDIHCASCNGKSYYKSYTNLMVTLPPGYASKHSEMLVNLRKIRPDKFTHFKKKVLKVGFEILP